MLTPRMILQRDMYRTPAPSRLAFLRSATIEFACVEVRLRQVFQLGAALTESR